VTRAVALAAACAASVAAFAGDDVAPPSAAPQRFESSDHKVALELPASWRVESMPSDHAALSLRITTPAASPVVNLDVFHMTGFLDARCQAYFERDAEVERYEGAARGDVFLEPLPHLVMSVTEGNAAVTRAWLFRVIDRNGFTLTVRCDPATWPAVKDACCAVAASLTSSIPEWPERPAGYVVSERDGYEYLVQPGVPDADVAALHAAVVELEKRYAKSHGPVPKPKDDRPVVVVSADREATRVAANVKSVDEDYFASVFFGRLYAVPIRADDAPGRAKLALAATEIFHAQCYGHLASTWLCTGEKRLAAADAWLGKPGGAASSHAALPKTVAPFDDVVHRPGKDAAEQATAYVALFRGGAKPWRDAFAAFLKDLAATGDWDAAERTHLLSLDQTKLRAAAQAFATAARPANGK